jgi:hypothetical protein
VQRAITFVVSVLASIVIASPVASAAPPLREGGGAVEVDLQFPAGAVCDFAVDVHLEMRTTTTTFVDANGDPIRGISTGKILAWETNADTGTTVFHSISGPSFFDASGALVWGTGAWSGIQLEDGTWIRAHGLIAFDANAMVTAVRGQVEPLCASLA